MKKISDKTNDVLEVLRESIVQDLDLDKELIRDCFPLRKPFSLQAGNAMLTVETRMKKRLNLPAPEHGITVIEAASRMMVFGRKVPAEEEGIKLLFRGSVLGIRNILGHNKPNMSKQEAIKIILFADYLIKLFEHQCKVNKIQPLP